MKEGWEYKKLKEIGRTQTGTTPSKSVKSFYGGVIPFIRPAELDIDGNGSIEYNSELKLTPEGALKSRMICKNSTLMCCIGSVGKTGYANKDVTCNQQINTITPYEGYNGRFVYYALLTPSFQNEVIKIANSAKATLAIISKGKWEEMSIPIPSSLSEQQSIVDYLDSAFAKIDAMKANAEKALNEAKALFQASLKEMLEPKEGWEEKKVKDLSLLITKGSSPKWQGNSYVNSDGILFVTSENVREGRLELNPKKFVDNSFNIKQRRSILKKFDVLVNIVGASIGRAAVFDLDVENANINQAVCLIRLDRDKMLPAYLCYFLNSEHAFKQYASMVKDTARANLSLENIGSLEIGIPPIKEQQSIVATLNSLKSKVDRLQENYDKISQECDALKQALLRQVFE